jgi:hypothetical protein
MQNLKYPFEKTRSNLILIKIMCLIGEIFAYRGFISKNEMILIDYTKFKYKKEKFDRYSRQESSLLGFLKCL